MTRGNLAPAEVQGLDIISNFMTAVADSWTKGCLYRGHAAEQWPVLARRFRPGDVGMSERRQLDEWKSIARRFVTPRPVHDLEFLVLAQHYGIPTALLDWTANPLIALFFACQPTKDKETGRVLQVARSEFKEASIVGVRCFPTSQPDRPLFDTSSMNVRSLAQDSFMSLHTESEAPLITTPVYDVPFADKFHVLRALALFGVIPERVYADIGVAAHEFVKRNLSFEALLG